MWHEGILLYIKGAEKNVCVCPQSEWFLWGSLPSSGVTFLHLAEQFVFIVLEFQEYYKEKCMSHKTTPGEQFIIVLKFQEYYVH